MRAFFILWLSSVALASCATTSGAPETSPNKTIIEASETDRLSPRKLDPNACGLFIWTANEAKKFLLFAEYDKGRAIWFNGEREEYLKTVSVFGDPSNGQYPGQIFETGDEKKLMLDLKQPEVITSGTRFKAGTLTISSEADWDKVRPVVGLSACQPG